MSADARLHGNNNSRCIAIVLKGYPRLSETFIAQEIHALEDYGFDVRIISLRHPYDPDIHPIHTQIKAPVLYLPEYVHKEPVRCIKALFSCLRRRSFRPSLSSWWQDFKRDRTANRARRFIQATVLASEIAADVELLYAHFLHTPASVTRYTSQLSGIPWSCSAHAKDIWTIPSWEKSEKISSLQWLVTCTRANFQHLSELAHASAKVNLLYHGLDFARIPNPENSHSERNGQGKEPIKLLSVGRAVEKKGYDVLLKALAALPGELNWQLTHIGGGANLSQLRTLASDLSIASQIKWLGPVNQQTVFAEYQSSDLFLLTSRIADDGDRDGLPNVLMEAQSQGLACLATNISGIPELIDHGITGWLIEPDDIEQTSLALTKLIQSPSLRKTLAEAGQARVRAAFSMQNGIALLVELINKTIGKSIGKSIGKTKSP